jgi:hypothetical protein
LYKDDWGVYPEALYGFDAQIGNNAPTTYRFLYPGYIDQKEDFRCPESRFRLITGDEDADPNATRPDTGERCATQGRWMNRGGQLTADPRGNLYYYPWDSYDLGVYPNRAPTTVDCNSLAGPSPITPPLPADMHYQRQWLEPSQCSAEPRQLICRAAADRTVVTWCLNHFHADPNTGTPEAGATALVAYLDGHVEHIPALRMLNWNGPMGNFPWQALPKNDTP